MEKRFITILSLGFVLMTVHPAVYAGNKLPPGGLHVAVRVSGTVTDSKDQPVEGVSVMIKDTKKGTTTNAQGKFSLEAPEGSTLTFSATGFTAQDAVVSGATMTIKLVGEAKMMEEVFVGYTRLRKSDVTGSISSVKASELNLSAPTLSQALVGKVAGGAGGTGERLSLFWCENTCAWRKLYQRKFRTIICY